MKRRWLAVIAVPAVVSAAAAAGATMVAGSPDVRDVAAVRPAASWGTPIKVSGLAALRKGGGVEVSSVSCASAGSCAAGG